MIVYLLHNEKHPLDQSLEKGLLVLNMDVEHVALPEDHEEIYSIFGEREPGVIFLPAIWKDLFSVKLVQEIRQLEKPFETVIMGAVPPLSELIVVFNEELSAFLEAPFSADRLKQIVSRVTERHRKELQRTDNLLRLKACESGTSYPLAMNPQIVERDMLLAQAFLDIMHGRGPIADGEVNMLLVAASSAQEKRLAQFLSELGINVDSSPTVEAACEKMAEGRYTVVISDSILPDGDAVAFVNRLRKMLKAEMPRFIVWSSSPDKAAALLNPDTHIDDVIIKPGPGDEIDYILPSLIAAIYQTRK